MIFDHTDVARLQSDYDRYIPVLKKKIIEKGGIVKDSFFPSDFQLLHDSTVKGANPFCKEYFGVETIHEAWQNAMEGTYKHFSEEQIAYYDNFKSFLSRCEGSYDVGLMNRLGVQLDPVSALFVAIDISIRVDVEAFDFNTVTKEWLEHVLGYLSKIGFSSYYYYPILMEMRKGYERLEELDLSDSDLDIIAEVAVFMQSLVKDLKISKVDLDVAQTIALDHNNKSAETFPGYGNLKNDDVKERTLKRSRFMEENMDLDYVMPFSQLHRIQSGGNVIFDYVDIKIDNETGKVIYNKEMLINALNQIAGDRGYSSTYVEKEPVVVPELTNLVSYSQLPDSYKLREDLVDRGEESAVILHKYKGTDDWMYSYKVTFPNAFTLVGDKYGVEYPELADKIFTKHRSVKASGPDFSRLGQMYLYPFMDELRLKLEGTPYESFVAQWMHPDYLGQMFTNMLRIAQPTLLDGKVDDTLNSDSVNDFSEFCLDNDMEVSESSDDKSGFDNFQWLIELWLFWTTFFSLPFDLSEEDELMFASFIKQMLFSLVISPEGLHIYQEIIASGGWFTSIWGTYNSNTGGLEVQAKLLELTLDDVEDIDNDDTSDITEVGGNTPEEFEDDEELE